MLVRRPRSKGWGTDFVVGVVGATADDPGLGAGFVVLDRDGIFADVLKPDVLEGAVAGAVHTLGLALADDGVLQGGALVEVEDGALPVALGLAAAGALAAVEALPLAVVATTEFSERSRVEEVLLWYSRLASLDLDHAAARLGVGSLRDTTSVRLAGKSSGQDGGQASKNLGGVHLEGLTR